MAALFGVVALLLPLAACDADGESAPGAGSDGLLREQDLGNLEPTTTEEDAVVDPAPSWECAGTEEQVLESGGWEPASRTYASPDDGWQVSTSLWRHDGGDAAAAMAELRTAVAACRAQGENVPEGGFEPDWFSYQSRSETGELEGFRGYTSVGDQLIAQVTLTGIQGSRPPNAFGDLLENSTRRAETVQQPG
ncbi:MAG: hypothetical protein Q7J48_02320 [Nocardioides sp.]|nr:hypothetical protein [Nocardioides sp.]